MRYVQALMAAAALSIIAAPVVAYAHDDEHEEHEGGDWDHHEWAEAQQERQEEWRDEEREEAWQPWYNSYSFGYAAPSYGYSYVQPYSYSPAPRCRWVSQRYYNADGYLVSRRVRSCW
jgi:hypothetical protein